jgi:hypothetical protein
LTDPGRLNAITLAVAITSMGVAAYALLARPSSDAATCGACDGEALREQIARLERRVDAAERTATRGKVERMASAATEPPPTVPATSDAVAPEDDDAGGVGPTPSTVRTTPRFVEFESPEPGLRVAQSENGAVGVSSDNPELAGRIIVLKARTEDGTVVDLPVTVPPVVQ